MPEPITVKRFLTDTALLVALTPALLFFMGWNRVHAHYDRLGLHDTSALPPTATLMMQGLTMLGWPLFGLALLYFVIWSWFCIQERRLVEPFDSEVPVFAWLAAAAWTAATFSVTDLNDDTRRIVADFTWLDLGVATVGALFGALVVLGSLRKGTIARLLVGETITGTVILVFVLTFGLVVHAWAVGTNEGNDQAWGCVDFPGVRLHTDIPEVDSNQTYLLVAHAQGFHYIRNLERPGNQSVVSAVPDTAIQWAQYSQASALRTCLP